MKRPSLGDVVEYHPRGTDDTVRGIVDATKLSTQFAMVTEEGIRHIVLLNEDWKVL